MGWVAVGGHAEAEAAAILQGYIEQLSGLSGGELANKFGTLASTESDCSSARNGGDLGEFSSGQMMKAFEVSLTMS